MNFTGAVSADEFLRKYMRGARAALAVITGQALPAVVAGVPIEVAAGPGARRRLAQDAGQGEGAGQAPLLTVRMRDAWARSGPACVQTETCSGERAGGRINKEETGLMSKDDGRRLKTGPGGLMPAAPLLPPAHAALVHAIRALSGIGQLRGPQPTQ
jgi:hypothetical protein